MTYHEAQKLSREACNRVSAQCEHEGVNRFDDVDKHSDYLRQLRADYRAAAAVTHKAWLARLERD